MTIYAENPGAVQSIREEIGRLEGMLSGNNFDAPSGETMYFPNNADDRRAKLQALLDEIEGRAPPVVVKQEPEPTVETLHALTHEDILDPRDEELAALRARVAELEQAEAPLLPAPDALMSDYGPVGTDDITGDLLLDAFEENETETAAIVQSLSALRLKHLSEQLNVERARLDREHQATGIANPRSVSIDRLLSLLTRRGEI